MIPKEEMVPSKIFWKAYDDFVRTCGMANEWTDATYARFSVLKNHLLAFNKRVWFKTFNEKGILGFTKYMRNTNHRNISIEKNLNLFCFDKDKPVRYKRVNVSMDGFSLIL